MTSNPLNWQYKKQHKPLNEETTRFHQGYFYPRHPEKCLSRENIYRSSWESLFMRWLDDNPEIVRWASEPVGIKYLNPVANIQYCKENNLDFKDPRNWKLCTYYVDIWYEVKQKDGSIKKVFGEIKPWSQTQKPKPINENASLKEHRAYNRAANDYLVNMAKWKAAIREFRSRGCDFVIITEKTLKRLRLL